MYPASAIAEGLEEIHCHRGRTHQVRQLQRVCDHAVLAQFSVTAYDEEGGLKIIIECISNHEKFLEHRTTIKEWLRHHAAVAIIANHES